MTKASSNPVFKPLIKFTIYGVVCVILLGYLALQVGNIKTLPLISHTHTYYAQLSDAESLVPPDDVKIAGVTVGQVHRVSVERGLALVQFSIDSKIHLRASTQVGMRFQNVIGDKFLYLYPGSSGVIVKPGGTFDVDHSVGGADVGDFLTDIGAFLKALNPNDINAFTQSIVGALQNNDAQVSDLLSNTATVSSTFGNLDTQVGTVIDNLQKIFSALAARDADLAAVTDHLASASQQLADRNDVLDNVVTTLGEANGQLDQLLHTNHANIDQIVTNLQAVASVLQSHRSDLNNDLTTLSAGLEPYTLISSYGQWFQIRVVYTCLARQVSCAYEDPAHPPATLSGGGRVTQGLYDAPLTSTAAVGGPGTVATVVQFALSTRSGA